MQSPRATGFNPRSPRRRSASGLIVEPNSICNVSILAPPRGGALHVSNARRGAPARVSPLAPPEGGARRRCRPATGARRAVSILAPPEGGALLFNRVARWFGRVFQSSLPP